MTTAPSSDWALNALRAEVQTYLSSLIGQQAVAQPVKYFSNGGNAGDSLIALGTFHCFERIGLPYKIIGPSTLPDDGTVIFAGGGNLIDLYSFISCGLTKHLNSARKIIVLPHTVRGNIELLQRLDARVTIFCRDLPSYVHCKENARNAAVFLGHDMAFHADIRRILGDTRLLAACRPDFERKLARFPQYLSKIQNKEVVHFLRRDAERLDHGLATDMDVSEEFMGEISDPASALQSTWCFLSAIAPCENGIITDRLHVAMAASLLGRKCLLLDNNYGKNSAVFSLSLAGRFPNTSLALSVMPAATSGRKAPRIALAYCVTGQPYIIKRLEDSIHDQKTLETKTGINCPHDRILVTDLPLSNISTETKDFFNQIVGNVQAFDYDPYAHRTYFSLSKMRNAALNFAKESGYDFTLLCDSDTVIAQYEMELPKSGFGVPEVYWQTEPEDIMQSLSKVRSSDENTFSKGNSWFLISAGLFKSVGFNENIYGYGYEDNEFEWRALSHGVRLQKTAMRVIHRFHPEGQRAIDRFSHIRNRAIFEYVKRLVRTGAKVDATEKVVSLPAMHQDWKGALVLFPSTSSVVHFDQFSTGKFKWEGSTLHIAWDKFPAESYKLGRDGILVSHDIAESLTKVAE